MNEVVLKQHTGLGDYIICNGLVRVLSETHNIILLVPNHYLESVSFMYRDSQNIKCTNIENFNYNNYKDIKVIGYDWTEHPKNFPLENFEQMFYRHANVDFTCKKTYFKLVRDIEREKKLFESLNLKPYSYSFLHEYNNGDGRTDVKINRNLIKNKNIISLNVNVHSNNIFDYITLINHAEEVHVIESSVLCLVDLCQEIDNKNLYCHRYAKKQVTQSGTWMSPKLCKNWIIY